MAGNRASINDENLENLYKVKCTYNSKLTETSPPLSGTQSLNNLTKYLPGKYANSNLPSRG